MWFRNRSEAGKKLAARLSQYLNRPDVIVVALPRGGVPVAFEVAKYLKVPMDILLVRKLGTPGNEEVATGAIASGRVRLLNEDLIRRLRIPKGIIEETAAKEEQEIARREKVYRGQTAPLDVTGRTVILIDDGIATGFTLFAAVEALKRQHPARVVIAVPVASPSACDDFAGKADELIVLTTPYDFFAVGEVYHEFNPVAEDDVTRLMNAARTG